MGEAVGVAEGDPEWEGLEEGEATTDPPPEIEGDSEEEKLALEDGDSVALSVGRVAVAHPEVDTVPKAPTLPDTDTEGEPLKEGLKVLDLLTSPLLVPVPLPRDPPAVALTDREGEGEPLSEAVPLVQMGSVGAGLFGLQVKPPPPNPSPPG